MKRFLVRFKRWIRKKYLILKYELNWNLGEVVTIHANDKLLGLSYLMVDDCIYNNYKLFVPTEAVVDYFLLYIYNKISNSEIFLQKEISYQDVQLIYRDYFITPMDIRFGKYKGKGKIKVIVDDSCSKLDLKLIKEASCDYPEIEIVNGFVSNE